MYVYIMCIRVSRSPGAAASHEFKMASHAVSRSLTQSRGCRLQSIGAETGRDLDKSTTQFYQVRLTTAPRLVQFV